MQDSPKLEPRPFFSQIPDEYNIHKLKFINEQSLLANAQKKTQNSYTGTEVADRKARGAIREEIEASCWIEETLEAQVKTEGLKYVLRRYLAKNGVSN